MINVTSRRKFLKIAGLGTMGAAIGARSATAQQKSITLLHESSFIKPFDEYMQMALYEPGLGYYDAGARKFGPGGDFTTAPEISPLFARALAAQLAQAFGTLAANVLEFGAGTGALAQELIAELQRLGVAVHYDIVEVSANLRARQGKRLAGLPVRWLDSLPEDFEGVILANEVLDVIPVRLFVRGARAVLERGVEAGADQLQFALQAADEPLQQAVAHIESITGALPEGYGSECCPLASGWLRALAASLRRGLILLLDYGFPCGEYYHPQRAMGTLMCHYRHQAHTGVLWMPGCNDITAHVDFSACARTAKASGLTVLGYTSQAHFLLNCGILDELAGALTAQNSAAVQRLVSEAEMGELVKAMALAREFDAPLLGFARGDRRHRL